MGIREFFSSRAGGGGSGPETGPAKPPEDPRPRISGLSRLEAEAVCAGKYRDVLDRIRVLPAGPKRDNALNTLYLAVARTIDERPSRQLDSDESGGDPIRDHLEEFQRQLGELLVQEGDGDE